MARILAHVAFAAVLLPAVVLADDRNLGALGEPAGRTFTSLDLVVKTHDTTQGAGTTHLVVTKDGKVSVQYENLPGDVSNARLSWQLTPAELEALQKLYAESDDKKVPKEPVAGQTPIEFQLKMQEGKKVTSVGGPVADYPGLKTLMVAALKVPKDRVDEKKDLDQGTISLKVTKKGPGDDKGWEVDMKVAPDGTVTGSYKGLPGEKDGEIHAKLSPERLTALRLDVAKANFSQKPDKQPADAMRFDLSTGTSEQGRWVSGAIADYPASVKDLIKELATIGECGSPALEGALDHPNCTGITRTIGKLVGD